MSTGMIIDGIFASEAIDSSGEILDVKGCDISDLENGQGVLNYEHRGDEAIGASSNDIIGKIVFAKKIYGPEDCTDSRQLDYWQKVQLPLIYGIVRLFDGSGHPGAISAAAIIRDYAANKEPLLIRYSIEGTTLKKEKSTNRLLESVARRVAATIKPCNKSCHSGLISDPNGKGDFTETKKASVENFHPNFTPLGGSHEYVAGIVESETIKKAIEAGSYNTAPGSLVGGSALQVEDKSLRNRVKAAVRDWDKKTSFKKFLKHRLPEASDDFLDRFSDLAEDFTIKKTQRDLIKAVVKQKILEGVKAKAKPEKLPKAPKGTPDSLDLGGNTDFPFGANDPDALTIRGSPIAGVEDTKPVFDERSGILHTPKGSFPMYIPSKDKLHPGAGQAFHNIMQDPKISKFHDYAMENWSKLHQHLKAGTLPPEVVMHGVLFSQLSPNTPVPYQELMYAHLVDAMRHTGKDPRSKEGLDTLRSDWLNRDSPTQWPEHSRVHFERLQNQLRIKNDSKLSGRKEGDIGSFMLANNKFKNMEKYHTLHDNMVNLVGRHKEDVRSAVEELMHHKNQAGLWDAKRQRDISKGKGDPGEYTAGPSVPGLAPKTARYTMGMLGGGNVVVPDTHFTRYLFGLDRDKDGKSIDYLKGLLWNENNSHLLNGIDRYYAKHHDAVKHMVQHPVWGQHFAKPEDAVFPAFWKNWVGILPHEAARGMKTNGFNEATDHRPFWEAVGPYLRKTEDGVDSNLALRTARTHHEWVQKYGEMPAQLMYFRYLVPQLLEAFEKRQQAQTIVKFEALSIELRKTTSPSWDSGKLVAAMGNQKARDNEILNASDDLPPPPETVKFNNKVVKPGEAFVNGQFHYILDHSPTHYTAVPEDKVYGWSPSDLVKLNRKGQNFRIVKHPEHLEAPSIVSHEVHGIPEYTHHDDVKELIHGLDLTPTEDRDTAQEGINNDISFWTKNAQGKRVYVKGERLVPGSHHNNTEFGDIHREALFHNLARDFYGLGKYVAPTGAIYHPKTGERMAVIQHVPGEHFGGKNRRQHEQALDKLLDSGEMDKLALMDMINHNTDRHVGNFMMNPDSGIKLIDHGYTFTDKNRPPPSVAYVDELDYSTLRRRQLHPEAAKWLQNLQPEELEMQMRRHGVPEGTINETKRRLKGVQAHVKETGSRFKPNGYGYTLEDAVESPFRVI